MDGGSDVVGLDDGAAENTDGAEDIDGSEDGADDGIADGTGDIDGLEDGADDGDSLGCSDMDTSSQKSVEERRKSFRNIWQNELDPSI